MRKHTEETKQKISEALKGKTLGRKRPPMLEKQKKLISEAMKGKTPSMKTRLKISNSLKGENSPMWGGGISTEYKQYGGSWTGTFRRSIRERDNYVCQLCNKLQCDKAFDVHHIDYDKKNCNPNNLITLCKNCHTKTNHNREYWIIYFSRKASVTS